MPLTTQCRILNLSRSGIYYIPVPISDRERELMTLIDRIHLDEPYLGTRGIRNELWDRGHKIGRSHVRTLMRKMGIEALYQKPRLSKPHPGHTIYPYLLKGVTITEGNKAWASDITEPVKSQPGHWLVVLKFWRSASLNPNPLSIAKKNRIAGRVTTIAAFFSIRYI